MLGFLEVQIQEDTESLGQRQVSRLCGSMRQVVKLSIKSGSRDWWMVVHSYLLSQPLGWCHYIQVESSSLS